MARPHKGERKAISLRLPVALAGRIDQINPPDRHGFIVDAVGAYLDDKEGNGNGRRPEEEAAA